MTLPSKKPTVDITWNSACYFVREKNASTKRYMQDKLFTGSFAIQKHSIFSYLVETKIETRTWMFFQTDVILLLVLK